MKKFIKSMAAFVLCGVLTGTQWMNVSAAEIGENIPEGITEETETTNSSEVNYDMEQGGKQVFVIEEEDGEESELVIEEMPEMARLSNKTYKITRTKPRAWTAGFYVKVSSSKITRVYDKFYKAIRGKITNVKLSKEGEAEGRLVFLYDINGGKKICGVKAKVSNKKLITTIF